MGDEPRPAGQRHDVAKIHRAEPPVRALPVAEFGAWNVLVHANELVGVFVGQGLQQDRAWIDGRVASQRVAEALPAIAGLLTTML